MFPLTSFLIDLDLYFPRRPLQSTSIRVNPSKQIILLQKIVSTNSYRFHLHNSGVAKCNSFVLCKFRNKALEIITIKSKVC